MAVLNNGGDLVITGAGSAQVTQYDASGNELFPVPTYSYLMELAIGRFTGAVTTGAVFAFRNGASKTLYIRRIVVSMCFDGTAAASTQFLQIKRFNTAAYGGGSALTLPAVAVKRNSSMGDSTLSDVRVATISGTSPLTVGSVVLENSIASVTCQRQVNAVNTVNLTWFGAHNKHSLQVAPNEGLAFIIANTAVVGDSIGGMIEWDEV